MVCVCGEGGGFCNGGEDSTSIYIYIIYSSRTPAKWCTVRLNLPHKGKTESNVVTKKHTIIYGRDRSGSSSNVTPAVIKMKSTSARFNTYNKIHPR